MLFRSTDRWLSVCVLVACQGMVVAQSSSSTPYRNPPGRQPNVCTDLMPNPAFSVGEVGGLDQDRPDGLADNQELPSVLRGNDGSAWYVRKQQSKVYMFGEHPGRKYATVFEGTLSNNYINGQYWDCPKGTRAFKGSLGMRLEERGDRLVVHSKSGGIDLSELESYAIENGQLPSAYRKPGFASQSKADLDGAWRSGDMNFYVREVDNRIVGWIEQTFAPGISQMLPALRWELDKRTVELPFNWSPFRKDMQQLLHQKLTFRMMPSTCVG